MSGVGTCTTDAGWHAERMPARWPLLAAFVVPLVLGTVVAFGVAFGVLTACTDTFGCVATDCAPCRSASTWLSAGWAAQGVLVVAALVLAVVVRRGRWLRNARAKGLSLAGLSLLIWITATVAAVQSY